MGMDVATVTARPSGGDSDGHPTSRTSLARLPEGEGATAGNPLRDGPEPRPAGRMRDRGREAPCREAGLVGERRPTRFGWDSVGVRALGRGDAFGVASGPAGGRPAWEHQ